MVLFSLLKDIYILGFLFYYCYNYLYYWKVFSGIILFSLLQNMYILGLFYFIIVIIIVLLKGNYIEGD